MLKPVINTKWLGEFQAQLYYNEDGIEVIKFYVYATPISEYYASTFLEIEQGRGLMLDGGSRVSLSADQVKEFKEFIIEHLVAKYIEVTEEKITANVIQRMNERKGRYEW